jgi:hypothetical protein
VCSPPGCFGRPYRPCSHDPTCRGAVRCPCFGWEPAREIASHRAPSGRRDPGSVDPAGHGRRPQRRSCSDRRPACYDLFSPYTPPARRGARTEPGSTGADRAASPGAFRRLLHSRLGRCGRCRRLIREHFDLMSASTPGCARAAWTAASIAVPGLLWLCPSLDQKAHQLVVVSDLRPLREEATASNGRASSRRHGLAYRKACGTVRGLQ